MVETEPLPSQQTDGCSTATYPAMMSEREVLEMSRHGEVLRWSSDEDEDNTEKTTLASDTTGSTPDIFKPPELSKGRVPGSIETDIINDYVIND